MRILMVAPEKLPLPGNGSVEICMLEIAHQLCKHHCITILSRNVSGLPSVEQRQNLTLHRLLAHTAEQYYESVLNYIHTHTFDLIQVDNRPACMARIQASQPHAKVTLFLHSVTFIPPTKAVYNHLKRADLIVVNSESLQNKLHSRFPHLPYKSHVVPLGVNVKKFYPPTIEQKRYFRNQYGLPHCFTVLFVGRMIPSKGVEVLLHAVSKLTTPLNVHLVLVGRCPDRYLKKLNSLVKKLRLSASFLGEIAYCRIHEVYGTADCLVCPSQTHEAFGLVNVEAMSCGIPVIGSNNGGIREIIVSGTNGYLVKAYSSPHSFARFILTLFNEDEHRKTLGINARETAVQSFGWQKTAEKLHHLYAQYDVDKDV